MHINVIGGGLAGSEAAYYIAKQGIKVRLFEMRPEKKSPVHRTGNFAELVCSNSLKSFLPDTAQGLLKLEMQTLGSLLLKCAELAKVPAGSALAVDRDYFSSLVSEDINQHPLIEVIREEVSEFIQDEINIIASGPLTSDALHNYLQSQTGENNLYFNDAIAPSITYESLNFEKVFRASRYDKGTADYLNCPMDQEEYEKFHEELIAADIKEGHSIDKQQYFQACTPIEFMARKGIETLRFGPMRPVGLNDPETGKQHYAVVQLRQEDKEGNIFGLVGFQTRIRWKEQERIFRLIPGLEEAEFIRFGVMHRNTYINSPNLLNSALQFKKNSNIFFAGQITGVEGYMESAATGIVAAINAVRKYKGLESLVVSNLTMIGALIHFISTAEPKHFQPINANFGIIPVLDEKIRNKKMRYEKYVERAQSEIFKFSELSNL